jgi:hypothetical protein
MAMESSEVYRCASSLIKVEELLLLEEKSSITFSFSPSPGFFSFSEKSFLPFCMGNFK